MDRRHLYGLFGEFLVRLRLRIGGFSILHSRYRSPIGEIDIIARRGELVLFVEVKSRSRNGALLNEACSYAQLARIKRTAEFFLSRHGKFVGQVRFDIYLVHGVWMKCLRDV